MTVHFFLQSERVLEANAIGCSIPFESICENYCAEAIVRRISLDVQLCATRRVG